MSGVLGYLRDHYEEYIRSGDPRVTKWPLIEGPGPILTITILYVIFVKMIGPWLMKDRKPFDLKMVMLLFNIVLAFLYARMSIEALIIVVRTRDLGICRKESPSDPDAIRMAEIGWYYTCIKLVEFIDTLFFVLRKKSEQISKLHVIHHAISPFVTWVGFRIEPGGPYYFFPLYNGMVHIVMYSYYALSALGPNVQKYLWWKKHLTAFQISQFVMVFLYMMLLLVSGCEVSKIILTINMVLVVLFFIMFSNFYISKYLKVEVNHQSHENRQSGNKGIILDAPSKDHSLRFNNSVRERRIQN